MKKFFGKVFLIAVTLIVMSIATVSAQTFGQSVWTDEEPDSSNFAEEVLELVNIERENQGLEPLELYDDLCDRADIRAEEIIEYFSHDRPDGSSCFTVLDGLNYRTCGENIAAGQTSPEDVMDSWMNSEGHRANILNPNFKYLGVGYAYDENSTYKNYWVQLFLG